MPNKRSTPQSVGTFREAFRQAKDSGVKTFMWKGKKYNTNLRGTKKSKTDKSKKVNVNTSAYWGPKYKSGGRMKTYSNGGRTKIKNIVSSMGEDSKVVITDRKLKEKGSRGKIKHKYDKEGNLIKVVRKKGLKRVVTKPKRDSRKTMTNKFRNIIDSHRTSRFSKGGVIQHD